MKEKIEKLEWLDGKRKTENQKKLDTILTIWKRRKEEWELMKKEYWKKWARSEFREKLGWYRHMTSQWIEKNIKLLEEIWYEKMTEDQKEHFFREHMKNNIIYSEIKK